MVAGNEMGSTALSVPSKSGPTYSTGVSVAVLPVAPTNSVITHGGKNTVQNVASPPRNWQWIFFPKAQLRHLVLLPPMTSLSRHEAHGRKSPGSAFSPPWGWGSGWGCWVSYGGVRGLEFRGCQFFETQLMHFCLNLHSFSWVFASLFKNLHTNINTRSWKKSGLELLGRPNKNLALTCMLLGQWGHTCNFCPLPRSKPRTAWKKAARCERVYCAWQIYFNIRLILDETSNIPSHAHSKQNS